MIGLFRQKSPANIAILLFFGLLIKFPLFSSSRSLAQDAGDGILYRYFSEAFSLQQRGFTSGLIAFLLLYIQALMITHMVNEYRMTSKQSFLPDMAYMIITSLQPEWSFLSGPLVAALFVIFSFIKLFELYNVGAANGRIYNLGLMTGLASLFYFPVLGLFPALIFGLMILRPFRLNEMLLVILGMTTPYYFYALYLFLNDSFSWTAIIPALNIHVPQVGNSLWLVGSSIFLTVPFLAGGYYVQTHLRKMLIQARKNWSIMLLYLFFTILVGFVNSTDLFTNWILAMAPFAAFHACTYLFPPRKWLASLLFFAVIAFIIARQYYTMAWQ